MEKKKILLIEDGPSQALFSKTILEEVGYDVILASTGEQGLASIDAASPHLILVNATIQDEGAMRRLKELRRKAKNYIPILLLTNEGDSTNISDETGTSADDSMHASFQQRELLARINWLVKMKDMMDQLVTNMGNEREAYQVFKQITLYDQLTDINNRYYFDELLEREFAMAQRYQLPMACIIGDLDNFREFNNAFGYASGDLVLREVANLLKENIRLGDILARFGGEEFILILPMTGVAAAKDLAERLRVIIENQIFASPEGPLKITMSFGVSGLPSLKVKKASDLIELVNRAVYRAKAFGRNRVEILLGKTQDLSSRPW
ncbi:MAG: diguanylate cyclase [Anaerolineaceae bacterium]|nr:diguanylate cyclase [Anaerolineaceae bacterium]